jgi:hypothetical protein
VRSALASRTDRGRSWRTLDVILSVLFFALVLVGSEIEKMRWWRSFGSTAHLLTEGTLLETFGLSFLFIKWKQDRLGPESIWEVKWLLFEVAMVIAGIVCFVQALG